MYTKKSKLQDKRDSIIKSKKQRRLRKTKVGTKNKLTSWVNSMANASPSDVIKNVTAKAVGKIVVVVAPVTIIGLLLIVPVFLLLVMCSGIGGIFSIIGGLFLASDDDLTKASEFYTELAYSFNEKILEIPNDWENQLVALGVNTDEYDIDPDNFIWNEEPHLSANDTFDFDPYKLWAFLTAYYYDFSTDDGEPDFWNFNSNTKSVITSLFERQYTFVHLYEQIPEREEDGVIHPAEVNLHYAVHNYRSFDYAIQIQLRESPNPGTNEERYELYLMLAGMLAEGDTSQEPFNLYGGHQEFGSPFAEGLQQLIQAGRIVHINGYNIKDWNMTACDFENGYHAGIDIRAVRNTEVLAVGNGTIRNVTESSFELHIENVPVFGEDEKTYTAIVTYSNTTGLTEGTVVTQGKLVGRVTGHNNCGATCDLYYLHIQIHDSNKNNIDPFLLIE
jgi:murein DD-endopeptidase MepM/ murein hydrolase activator NlpD